MIIQIGFIIMTINHFMIKLLMLLLTLSACTDNIATQELNVKSVSEAIKSNSIELFNQTLISVNN